MLNVTVDCLRKYLLVLQ